MAVIRYGPAGWEYDDWAGIVYPRPEPPGFDRLAHLSRYFGTVEIDATFYRPFSAGVAARWCERVAGEERFRFAAKLWRRFTHERDPYTAAEVASAREALDALHRGGRLGAVLLQFPFSFRREPAAEEWLRDLFRAFRGLPLVLEVRHASWDDPEVLEELFLAGVGVVNVDQPRFRNTLPPRAEVTSKVAYVRVHGRNWRDWFRKGAGRDARYNYLYSARELEPWADRVREMAASSLVPDVYVVTNNHFRGQAVANAKMLEALGSGDSVDAPPELLAHYRDALAPFVRSTPGP
ncbi:MAG TPA: DUF72 domain-containing protein [Anaeromyxobacter sp.]|nr:DUF72 domain-containing protein [Anaeromyxobacter sp.]